MRSKQQTANKKEQQIASESNSEKESTSSSSSSSSSKTTTNTQKTIPFTSITPELSTGVLNYLKKQSFAQCTPVQSAVIPLLLTYKDVCVQAVTGSGKSLAFLIPTMEILLRCAKLKRNEVGAIILSPTRELAQQIHEITTELCNECKLPKPLLCVGQKNTVLENINEFTTLSSDIIVATPGRLNDILNRYDAFKLSSLEVLILDEADVLLNMGFEATINSILSYLPKQRRTGLFSATQTTGLTQLVRAGLRNPVMVSVDVNHEKKSATPVTLQNYHIVCPLHEKSSRLVHFLKSQSDKKCIVFFLTCADVEFYLKIYENFLENVTAIHGKMNQKRRDKTIESFHAKTSAVLLCTDVASRGIDIPNVHWVIQVDAPQDPDCFIHRVGRCARAGKVGYSCLFLSPKEDAYLNFLKIKGVNIQPLNQIKFQDFGKKHFKAEECQIQDATIHNILPQIKDIQLQDRDVLEKGTKAFIAHVRAYKEHHCSFIFRFNLLDLGLLAQSYCLFELPKMKEMKELFRHLNFYPSHIDTHQIPYKDQVRETARQKRFQELKSSGKLQEKKEQKIQKNEEKKRKALIQEHNQVKKKKKKGKQKQIYEEWDELAREQRLYKKFQRKKITKEEYKILLNKGNSTKNDLDSDADSI